MMRSPIPVQVTQTFQNSDVRIITDRHGYTSGHVLTSDLEKRLPAICVDGQYYSFFRVETSEEGAVQTAQKLRELGDLPIMTRIPKGYAVWILERDAQLSLPSPHPAPSDAKPPNQQGIDANPAHADAGYLADQALQETAWLENSHSPYRVLTTRNQYRNCYARVAGLDQPVKAIEVEGQYYSLFKTVVTIQESAQWVKQLAVRGDYTVVTRMPQGYGVWVLEEKACPIESCDVAVQH